ncbi:MAG: glycosyltransferase family 4 protein [Clostridiales bacterium]|jgi:glycosyltransferase involved in cell wall biosynthesis|nr:glycosyltransferase family 4 protein [Clostridiales bacterium]
MANILHIAAHLGDGAGKAISGLAILGSREGGHSHRILLLQEPRKLNHIERCKANGVAVLPLSAIDGALAWADIAVISYWASAFLNDFIRGLTINKPLLIWYHNNGFSGELMPDDVLDKCERLLVTTPATLGISRYAAKNPAPVYGFGDFNPGELTRKTDYSLKSGALSIGYVGMPTYKRLPSNFVDYCDAALGTVPNSHFTMLGENDGSVQNDIARRGMGRYFTFIGWRNNVYDNLRRFDVFSYLMRPDTTASIDNSALEAMAVGLPVVISQSPIGCWIVQNGATGLTVNNPQEYASAIRRLFDSEAERRRLGQAARRYAISHCSAVENLRRFNAEIERVAK